MSNQIRDVSLIEETEKRYLNYAVSVITSRALPDVRDGLKPVQRRILYAMYQNLKLIPGSRYRKSATVVGEVMGKYHPHGDQAIYDAMVRMAQAFSLLHPLVDGYGNFGSVDGDKAAAMRYTESRLQPISVELLDELKQNTVEMRANFDGSLQEPVVLPARYPNLLVNGSTGIAVGMATNIPPHNLGEVLDGLLMLMDKPDATNADLVKVIKGPDFPTGGEVIATRQQRIEIYEQGQGNLTLRGEWKEENLRGLNNKIRQIVIQSIPYGVVRSAVVEKIADIIVSRKLAALLDVRDESTEETRIVLELKANADPELIMAYLYKDTPLEQRFSVNMTCLIPTSNPQVSAPERLSLKQVLEQFLGYRLEVMDKRFRNDLERLLEKIHILQGFRKIFDALDETLAIVRKADGRKDAGDKLKQRFKLTEKQAEAILETRLYRLSRLEIDGIISELKELRQKADDLDAILGSRRLLMSELRRECEEIRKKYAQKRRTKIRERTSDVELQPEDLIQDEDTHVILTRDGWVKRIRTITDIKAIRVRESDEIILILPGGTRESVCFFSNAGTAFTARIWDIPATAGYGVPLQSLFKFRDGEKIVAAISLDERICGDIGELEEVTDDAPKQAELLADGEDNGLDDVSEDKIPPSHLLIVSEHGQGSRISLAAFQEPSNKNGRRYVRLNRGDQVLDAYLTHGDETLILASEQGRYLMFGVREVKFLGAPGKGVRLIQLNEDELLFASAISRKTNEGLRLEADNGQTVDLLPEANLLGKRATKGKRKNKVNKWKAVIPTSLQIPSLKESGNSIAQDQDLDEDQWEEMEELTSDVDEGDIHDMEQGELFKF